MDLLRARRITQAEKFPGEKKPDSPKLSYDRHTVALIVPKGVQTHTHTCLQACTYTINTVLKKIASPKTIGRIAGCLVR